MFSFKQFMFFVTVTLICTTFCSMPLAGQTKQVAEYPTYKDSITSNKNNALHVLQIKCNVCHNLTKKSSIFTIDNMDDQAKKINKQVFIKKKMPKDGVILSEEEYRILQKWLNEVLISSK